MLGEKVDRWITGLTAIPVFGVIIKMVIDKITEKGVEKITHRLEKILGIDVEAANKDITDEIIYSVAVNSLDDAFSLEIDAFEERLRREQKEKAEAFVLFIAKLVSKFEREVKKTENPKKGETGPSTSQTYKDLEVGIEHAKKFLEALLRNVGTDADATFTMRIAFLQGKNVFSLIKSKKEDLLEKALDKGIKLGEKALANTIEKLADVSDDVNKSTKSYEERSIERLAASKARRMK